MRRCASPAFICSSREKGPLERDRKIRKWRLRFTRVSKLFLFKTESHTMHRAAVDRRARFGWISHQASSARAYSPRAVHHPTGESPDRLDWVLRDVRRVRVGGVGRLHFRPSRALRASVARRPSRSGRRVAPGGCPSRAPPRPPPRLGRGPGRGLFRRRSRGPAGGGRGDGGRGRHQGDDQRRPRGPRAGGEDRLLRARRRVPPGGRPDGRGGVQDRPRVRRQARRDHRRAGRRPGGGPREPRGQVRRRTRRRG